MKYLLLSLLLLLPTTASAQGVSICDTQPGARVDGIAIVTVYKQIPGGITYDVDFQANPYLTRRDGLVFSAVPRGYNGGTYYKTLYHVDCVTGEDTVFVIGNMEASSDITAYVECLRDGKQIFTQGNTFRAGTVSYFRMAHCLAGSF